MTTTSTWQFGVNSKVAAATMHCYLYSVKETYLLIIAMLSDSGGRRDDIKTSTELAWGYES